MTISLAIRGEFERRRREGQAGVDAGRMNRDAVNRNLALWRDIVMWSQGQVPLGDINFSGWAAAALTAAHKCAARLSAQQGQIPPSSPAPAAQPDSDGWNTETIEHARALRAASIKLYSLGQINTALRAGAQPERMAA